MKTLSYARVTFLVLLFPFMLSGQNKHLLPVVVNGKYGFIDTSGNMVISPRYDRVFDFGRSSYSVIVNDGRYGVISINGQEVIPCREDSIMVVNDSVFALRKDKHWGLVTPGGLAISNYDIDDVFPADLGMIRIRKGDRYGLLSPAGSAIVPAAYDYFMFDDELIIVFKDGLLGLYGSDGIKYLDAGYDDIFLKMHGLVFFEKDSKMGYLSLKSGKATQAEWDEVILLEHYYANRNNRTENHCDVVVSRNGKKGLYLTMNDSLVLPAIYDAFEDLMQGYIVYWKKDRCGLISAHGKQILDVVYNDIFYVGNKYLKVRTGNKYGICDTNGRVLISPKYNDLTFLQNDGSGRGIFCYKDGNLTGLVRSDSVELTEAKYSNIESRQAGFLVSVLNGQYGTLALNGKTILEPQLDHIGTMLDNVYVTHKNKKVGLLNNNGKPLAEAENDKITVVGNTIKAYKGDFLEIIWIDANGEVSDRVSYNGIPSVHVEDQVRVYEWAQPVNSIGADREYKFFFSEQEGKWGLKEVNSDRVVISPRYDRIARYPDQWFTFVFVKTDTLHYEIGGCHFYSLQACGMVDIINGNELLEPKYLDIALAQGTYSNWVARVITGDGEIGYANRTGVYTGDYAWVGRFRYCETQVNMGGELIITAKEGRDVVVPFSEFINSFKCRLRYADKYTRDMVLSERAMLACDGGTWGQLHFTAYQADLEDFEWLSRSYSGSYIIRINGQNALWRDGFFTRIRDIDYEKYLCNRGDQPYFVISSPYRKYGFIDRTGALITTIEYDRAGNFSEGLASVMKDEKWGFIGKTGEIKIPLSYTAVSHFHEGLAGARMAGKWGFIDQNGDTVITARFNSIGDFHEGVAAVRKSGHSLYVDHDGNPEFDETFTRCGDFRDGYAIATTRAGTGVISRQGEWMIPPQYDRITCVDAGLDMVIVFKKNKYGLIRLNGKRITPLKYNGIRPPSDGLLAARLGTRWGFIDPEGRMVIPFDYYTVRDFSCERAIVRKKGKWGSIDKRNRLVMPYDYRYAESYSNGVCIAGNSKINKFIINAEGQIIDTLKNTASVGRFSENKAVVTNDYRQSTFVDIGGNALFNKAFDLARPFRDSLAMVMLDGNWGIIDARGQWVVQPCYDSIRNYSEGLAVVGIMRLEGVADERGVVRIPPQYHSLEAAPYGLIRVRKDGAMGYIDFDGTEVWKPTK
jgi:hypothetical protein